jgi:hypothetical protein
MADQRELDLPPPASPSSGTRSSGPSRGFAGFNRAQLLLGAAIVLGLVWSMWVTKVLLAPREEHIVKASLSNIVGEYVNAQARSASPPAQVEAEMRAFMSSLDHELQRRSASGQVVLVGEAVLTKNVPDITDSLRKAVYASGVRQPRQASAQELQQLQQRLPPAVIPQAYASPAATIDPMAAAPQNMVPQQAVPGGTPAAPSAPGASISTFGGQDGGSGQ